MVKVEDVYVGDKIFILHHNSIRESVVISKRTSSAFKDGLIVYESSVSVAYKFNGQKNINIITNESIFAKNYEEIVLYLKNNIVLLQPETEKEMMRDCPHPF
jgi:hypothetical protein